MNNTGDEDVYITDLSKWKRANGYEQNTCVYIVKGKLFSKIKSISSSIDDKLGIVVNKILNLKIPNLSNLLHI
jgi:hypothetical protein